MSQHNPPTFGGRNTVSSEDERLAANPASTVEDDAVSVAGSVDDQNNLVERNLLPGEVGGLPEHEKHENIKNLEKQQNRTGIPGNYEGLGSDLSHKDIFGEQVQLVTDIQVWSQGVVNWLDFNNYDRDAASARQDPIKSSAIDWLLSLSPKKQLDSTYLGNPLWVGQGWGGYPNLAIEIKREILVGVDAAEGTQFDALMVDRTSLGIAWPEAGSPGSPYKPSELRGRPSLKHYNAAVSPQILTKIQQTLDPTTAKFWQTSLQLRNENDAMWIFRYRAKGAQVGDNHLPLLVAAWQYYFDAVAASTGALVCSKLSQRAVGYAYNIYKDVNWVGSVAELGKEIVNCIGMPQDYATFWTLCCLPSQELFSAKTSPNGVVYKTPFGAWRRRLRTPMCVISEHTITIPTTAPSWWANPNMILSFMEMYSMKFGLDDQLNDALYIAVQIPLATVIGTPLTIPEPVHSKDWFEGMVEPGVGLDAVRQLHLSSPAAVTAAWSTSQSVMVGTLSEVVEAEVSQRLGVAVTINTFSSSVRALSAALRRPGTFAATILAKVLHLPTTALELTGLHASFVPVGTLVPPILWNYNRLSMWQHELIPLRAAPGFLHSGPKLHGVWFPSYVLTPAHLVTDANELQILRRFRILELDVERGSTLTPYDTVWTRSQGRVTVPLTAPMIRQKLALIKKYGLRIQELGPADYIDLDQNLRDPAEAVELYNSWQYAGICPSVAGSDVHYGGHKLAHRSHCSESTEPTAAHPSLARAVHAAEVAQHVKRAQIFSKLRHHSQQYDVVTGVPQGAVAEFEGAGPPDNETGGIAEVCGWEQIVLNCDRAPTVAAARRLVGAMLGKDPTWAASLPDKLSLEEVAVISSSLKMDVMLVEHCEANGATRTVVIGSPGYEQVMHLSSNHWSRLPLLQRAAYGDVFTGSVSQELLARPNKYTEKEKGSLYNKAIERFNSCSITKQQLINAHRQLFPDRQVPRSMASLTKNPREPSIMSQAGSVPRQGKTDCTCGCLSATVTELIGGLEKVAGSADAYPFRNSATARKNNILPGDIIRFLTSNLKQSISKKATRKIRVRCAALWMLRRVGQASEFVTSVASWVIANTLSEGVWRWLWCEKALSDTTEDHWLVVSKAIHDSVRKHGFPEDVAATEADWAQSLYLQALYGRGGVLVDWAAEFKNKSTDPDPILAWDGTKYNSATATTIIKDEIESVVATAYPKATPQTFDKFMDNAYEWLVSGSTAGMPSVLKNSPMRDTILSEYGLSPRPTKRSVMEAIPRSEVLSILTATTPKVVAKAHMKLNETGGKARAIYGVTIWHYIFSNWLMAPLEKHIDHPAIDINLDGSAMLAATMHRLAQVEAGMVFNSYDYPDFNSMHTHNHMALIYRSAKRCALAELRAKRGASASDDDIRLIEHGFDWLIESTYNQYVLHPDTGDIIKTTSGLYSGNRDTTLINTLLNIAYAKVVDTSLQHKYVEPHIIERLCHGDDIITVHRTLPSAILWNEEAGRCNLKGQETKLMIDHHHHEYLRIMGCSDAKLRGCLARCVATHVNGNWETDRVVGVWAKLQEAASSMATWIRRGADKNATQQLWNISRYRMLVEQYGFSRQDASEVNIRTSTTAENRREPEYSSLPSHVTGPYINTLVAQLPSEIQPTPKELSKLKRVLQKSTYGTELPLSFQQTDLTRVTDTAIKAVVDLGSGGGRPYVVKEPQQLRLTGAAKTDWQLRNRIKAVHHLLSALDVRSRSTSRIELVSAITGAAKPAVSRVLEADADLERSAKTQPRWHLPAELASTLVEIEWSKSTAEGKWPDTALGGSATPDKRVLNDVLTYTENYTEVLVGDVLKY